jgi:hypothetical protein
VLRTDGVVVSIFHVALGPLIAILMPSPKNKILVKMLDRLFAGLISGPNLNCRPHSSRQRLDWTQLARLQDCSPADALRQLFSDKQAAQLQARVKPPKNSGKSNTGKNADSSKSTSAKSGAACEESPDEAASPEDQQSRNNWTAQQGLLTKLRGLTEDARDYEQDTGVHVLHVGFPLLSLPPGAAGSLMSAAGGSRRLLAPIAFIPVALEMRSGLNPAISIQGLNDGADFLVPNEALFAWLERQTGQSILPDISGSASSNGSEESLNAARGPETAPSTGADSETDPNAAITPPDRQEGATREPSRTPVAAPLDPWEEVNDLIRRVASALHLPPCTFSSETLMELQSAPRTDSERPRAEIVPAAVLGLFPMNNQGLLRDMQAMVSMPETLQGPVQSFLSARILLDEAQDDAPDTGDEEPDDGADASATSAVASNSPSTSTPERLITIADPCQARAVKLARECQGLVIHGPPGTGKSQTITNMIGDHLARGERVLLVCDKRTALDVVARRLEHVGLGQFCALIHDPQHDQRNLYMQVREQLEELSGTQSDNRASARLKTFDEQLQRSRESLQSARDLLMTPDPIRQVAFHDRMGEWLEAALPSLIRSAATAVTTNPAKSTSTSTSVRSRKPKATSVDLNKLKGNAPASLDQLQTHWSDIREIVRRAIPIQFAGHPWKSSIGIPLATFLSRPMSNIRDSMTTVLGISIQLDQSRPATLTPLALPEDVLLSRNEGASEKSQTASASRLSFPEQRASRQQLLQNLQRCLNEIDAKRRQMWAESPDSMADRWIPLLKEAESAQALIQAGRLDPDLRLIFQSRPLTPAEIASQIGRLEAYLAIQGTWYFWFAFAVRRQANELLQSYGLAPGPASAERLKSFLVAVMARLRVGSLFDEATLDDDRLQAEWDRMQLLLRIIDNTRQDPALTGWLERIPKTLTGNDQDMLQELENSLSHLEVLEDLRQELVEVNLFHIDWLRDAFTKLCRGESITGDLRRLEMSLETLGDLLRTQSLLAQLPGSLKEIVDRSLGEFTELEEVLNAIRHQVLTDDIDGWLKSNPKLQSLDGVQLTHWHHEVRRLEGEKQQSVQELVREQWIRRQRERLLVTTGSRLNSLGADLRRRLTTRGERAMRLRQVIAAGSKIDGGDPLFDLRPVWMASPETVAQIFPRQALFDVVIFDEASQCRLEEALPVLTRARRVVIAGDPKQLPPTRFFESAVITSDNSEVETEQDLFEAHQSETEDLLSAALSLNIQESYLDVHYRSRNSDLVQFSNQQFYGSRLQAIPGHPKNRLRFAPISLYQVGGIYEERRNQAEAAQVCKIVADLLLRAEPPSIGIACFNLTQRDLILESLDEMAAADDDFAERLAVARSRVGSGAFEGLFVKNLENVQGDERDHMIISTTYGRDKQGRFFRRFGPLGQAGGGRRLNVLITRAREEVHLVTSIPADFYRQLPPIPDGQYPGGGWLLFAYLAYAERLASEYDHWRTTSGDAVQSTMARVQEYPSRNPSQFGIQLARLAAAVQQVGSDTHWGNDGFCVDVAFHHPRNAEDRTLGLLCDGTRFRDTEDPVAWDVFRTAILEQQGWQLSRCCTPQFFRDPAGSLNQFLNEARRIADTDPDPESIPVNP